MATAKWRVGGGILGRLAQILGLNSIPVAGMFGEGWSQGTALAVYWIEGLLVILFVALRVVLHRRWTRKAGHMQQVKVTTTSGRRSETKYVPGSLLSGYLGTAIPFTLVHGLFLSLLLFLFLPREFGPDAGVSLPDLELGMIGVLVFLVLGFVIDLVQLRSRSFRWIELVTQRALGRIFVVHLTIIFGMFAAMYFHAPAGLFLVFAALKTLVDLGSAFPHKELELEPPRWTKILDRIPARNGESFSDYWRRTEMAARQQREANERELPELR
jgi:hypothetical protein